MKHLPCEHCRANAWVKVGQHEEPLVVGKVRHFPYRYKCSRCKKVTTLAVKTYNQLASLSVEELRSLGIVVDAAEPAAEPAGTTPAAPGEN